MEWLSLLSEILGLLFVVHNLISGKFVVGKYTVAFLVVETAIFLVINVLEMPPIGQVLAYILFLLYLLVEFKNYRLTDILICTMVAVFLVGGTQIFAYMLLFILSNDEIRAMLANGIALAVILFLMKVCNLGAFCKYIMKNNRTLSRVIIFCGIIFCILVVLFKFAEKFTFLECLLIYTIFLLVIVCGQQWKNERCKRLLEEREQKVLKQCNDSFECLIEQVRSKQHEFNNQLEAVYSLQYVCSTYEELVNKQNELVGHIARGNRFNQLLSCQCPSVIKGFLYSKFEMAYENEIEINYSIFLQDIPDSLVFDIQETIGVLFDNACEAVEEYNELRRVDVNLCKSGRDIYINVENPFVYVNQEMFQCFLKKGYSSKGKHRGMELNNVKQIVDRYAGSLMIENKDRSGLNWFCIKIQLCL